MKTYLTLLVIASVAIPLVSFASINSNLMYGSSGPQVTELQEYLISKGILNYEPTGNFFALTLRAVEAYQASVGLPATGFVGPLTRAEINTNLAVQLASSTQEQIAETGTSTPPQACTGGAKYNTVTGQPCEQSTNQAINNLAQQVNGLTNAIQNLGTSTQPVASSSPTSAPPANCVPNLQISASTSTSDIPNNLRIDATYSTTCLLDNNTETALQSIQQWNLISSSPLNYNQLDTTTQTILATPFSWQIVDNEVGDTNYGRVIGQMANVTLGGSSGSRTDGTYIIEHSRWHVGSNNYTLEGQFDSGIGYVTAVTVSMTVGNTTQTIQLP
jgi:peptidoglycan hydrolase-like protein with peptidoglycan-binding domain